MMLHYTVINGQFEIGFDIDLNSVIQSEPKTDPKDTFEAQYNDTDDSPENHNDVPFRRNREIKELKDCDTPHLLYLLQIACDLHRKWVMERNQYFASISRTDRFIDPVDAPQLITNLLKWHIEDKEQNVFNGAIMEKEDEYSIIHDFLVRFGTYCLPCYANILASIMK